MVKWHDLKTYDGRHRFYCSDLWGNIRKAKLSLNPLCEECFREGRIEPATQVHHKKDLSEDSTMLNATELSGLESLCASCHSRHTFNEHTKGKWEKSKNVTTLKKKWDLSLNSEKCSIEKNQHIKKGLTKN